MLPLTRRGPICCIATASTFASGSPAAACCVMRRNSSLFYWSTLSGLTDAVGAGAVSAAEPAPRRDPGNDGGTDRPTHGVPCGAAPRLATLGAASELFGEARDDGGQSREFFGRGASRDHSDVVNLRHRHSGMFPCFLGGVATLLVRSARSAFVTATRVAAGSMTPSSSPRSAARKGLATL